jgi:hypothetical protein
MIGDSVTFTPEVNSNRVLDRLAAIAGSAMKLPTYLEFVDIAGLVRGASKGEGLGNQFLAHIREVDAILHVLRCFENSDIVHVEGGVDPLRDAEIINTELMIADLESLERRRVTLQKRLKVNDKEAKILMDLIDKAYAVLKEGKPARSAIIEPSEKELFKQLQLLTQKPVLYVCNVGEDEAHTGNHYTEKVKAFSQAENASMVVISAAIESEISLLPSEEEKKEFLKTISLEETGLSQIIRAGHSLLELITFFTIGPKEARAWTVRDGALAPEAAGVIHTDFERGFICAETIACEDYIQYNGEQGAKNAGKIRLEGKEYRVQDGDVFHFRFNV